MRYRIDKTNLTGEEVRQTKREEAEERQAAHDALTVEQKIAKLDAKFGEGKGATKERLKLHQALTEPKEEKPKSKKKKKKKK